MSFRVYVGVKPERKQNLYDYRLDECGMDLAALAKRAAWRLPLRIYGHDQALITKFLEILDTEYCMTVDDISQVRVLEP